ncbi:amidohydrolase [Mobilitalea sibirica]|uniref:Amidohydrolase n=1 Tax=Mobilitalea sibirica TaxID=1462919 RepID=A0A8J7H1W1_9FIRM|nr:amidohydrolase [Mobilitalea sibirica]MBH1940543.1 amidohydrolase [Mobilitalea sibirica]
MNAKEIVINTIEEKKDQICSLNDQIFYYAEGGFREEQSANLYCSLLKEEGFHITNKLADIPTAFKASYGDGAPYIGVLAEYDALPFLSQKPGVPYKEPLVEGAHGHGCGHCALGAGVFATVLAVKEFLVQTGIKGTIELYGCPAEEVGCGKSYMVNKGVFDHLDAVYTWHPSQINGALSKAWISLESLVFTFTGITSHASISPDQGRSALDACELMNVGSNYLREHLIPESRIHYAYLDSGGTFPNVVPDKASLRYVVRAPRISQVNEIVSRVLNIAKGAALMTDTTMDYYIESAYYDFKPNHVLAEVLNEAVFEIGAPTYEEEDFQLAKEFFDLYEDATRKTLIADLRTEFNSAETKNLENNPINTFLSQYTSDTSDYSYVSTDVGNVAYVVPTAMLGHTISALGTPLHSWQLTAQAATSIAHKGLINAGKIMALACCKLFENPELTKKAKLSHQEYYSDTFESPIPKDAIPPKTLD